MERGQVDGLHLAMLGLQTVSTTRPCSTWVLSAAESVPKVRELNLGDLLNSGSKKCG